MVNSIINSVITVSYRIKFGIQSLVIALIRMLKIQFIDWIEFIFRNEKSYHMMYTAPLEKIIGITWAIWTHRNIAVFKNWKVNPDQVINCAECTFHDIEYFNNVSDLFQQVIDDRVKCRPNKKNPHNGIWLPPDRNWIKINVDASRRDDVRSSSIGFIMQDYDAGTLMTYGGRLGDCPVVVAECEAIRQAIIKAIMMGRSKVRVYSDSQSVVKAVNRNSVVPKDIINLVEDIKWLSSYFTEFVLEYCSREDNKQADEIAKKAHMYSSCTDFRC